MTRIFSSANQRLLFGFLIAAGMMGFLAFFVGQGIRELLTQPRYRPTLPTAGAVPASLYHARLSRQVRAPSPTERSTAHTTVETPEGGNWIRIPSLSLHLPLALAPTLEDKDILRTLQVGVVRYPNGVSPGERGVVVVAGHSTGEPWKGPYRFAFLHAGKLRSGDVIAVDQNGMRYTYRVTGQRIINPSLTPFLDSTADHPRLSIISCWPLWTTQQRLVIDAELVETARLAVRPQRTL